MKYRLKEKYSAKYPYMRKVYCIKRIFDNRLEREIDIQESQSNFRRERDAKPYIHYITNDREKP